MQALQARQLGDHAKHFAEIIGTLGAPSADHTGTDVERSALECSMAIVDVSLQYVFDPFAATGLRIGRLGTITVSAYLSVASLGLAHGGIFQALSEFSRKGIDGRVEGFSPAGGA